MSTTQTTTGPASAKGLDSGYSEQDTRWTTGYFAKSKIDAFTFQNAHKHINALRRQNNVFILVLKLAVCTPVVRVFNDNYPSLTLPCLTLNDP